HTSVNVPEIIEEYIIKNWPSQDEPEHLKTISDRLLSNDHKTIELLSLYQQILTHTENPILADYSQIQTDLRLSGLVVQKNNILQVYNPIYQTIFNQHWIQDKLNNIRPYSAALNQWVNSQYNPVYLLPETELTSAKQWTIDKQLSKQDYQFLADSQTAADHKKNEQLLQANNQAKKMIKIGGFTLISTSILSILLAITAGIYTNQQIKLFEKTLEIEKTGLNTLQQFQSNQIDSLISAIKGTEELKKLVNKEQNLANYPTTTPLVTLLNILTKIHQKNEIFSEKEEFNTVSFSPDDQIIVSGSNQGKIKLWQKDGTLIKTIDNQGQIYAITFSSDGKIIISGNDQGEIKLWQKDGTLIKTINDQGKIYAITFSSDGKIIASGNNQGEIKLWQKNGTLIKTINGHQGTVYSINFSPNNQMIVSGSNDNTIKLWTKDGKLIRNITQGKSSFYAVNFSSDSQNIVSGSYDQTVQVWDINGQLQTTLYGHNDIVNTVSFSPDNQMIISGSKDKTIKLWQKDGTLINTLNGHKESVLNMNVSKDGKMIVSGSQDQTIKIWQMPDYQDKIWISSVNFSPDGKTIIYSGGGDTNMKIINTDGLLIKNIPVKNDITNINFSPDQKTIVFKDQRKYVVKLWQNNKIIEIIPKNDIIGMNFTPDGQLLTGSKKGEIQLWNLQGKLIKTMNYNLGESQQISFSKDGKKIASSNKDGQIEIWDIEGRLMTTLIDHNNIVTTVSFNPDNQIIASGDSNGKINIWRPNGQLIFSINTGTKINSLNFSPDGQKLIIGTNDGRLITWNLTPDELIKTGCQWLEEYIKNHPQLMTICPQNQK
ncbi:MAG TPA: WD40 repeat domain-containing protein, partial [Allocoleopsis sp.]